MDISRERNSHHNRISKVATRTVTMRKILTLIFLFSLSSSCMHWRQPPTAYEIETKKFTEFFDREFEGFIKRHPQFATNIGRKDGYDKLDSISSESTTQEYNVRRNELKELAEIKYTFLTDDQKTTYDYFRYSVEQELAGEIFRYHDYPVNQMFGKHSDIVTLMTNKHRINSIEDARAYISRLKDFRRYLDELMGELKLRQNKKIVAPVFALEKSIGDIRNIIAGKPFDESAKESVLFTDFKKKVSANDFSEKNKSELMRDMERALLNYVAPAYIDLINFLEKQKRIAPKEGAAWALPNGAKYYEYMLKYSTTSDFTARQIHEYGKKEVSRIQKEMMQLMPKLGYVGSDLKGFFRYVKNSPQFYYPDSNEGRSQFLRESQEKLDNMQARLGEMFNTFPKASLIVKPVEPFREKSAGLAFYESPAEDGSAPGIYYINLGNMAQANRFEMEALAYHEGLPGHHMQISIAQERKDLPPFRRFRWLSAFSEGWGLYAEQLGKEMGMYQDPVYDFGRLSMELWRSARLVVDTGLHWKRWTIEETKKYLRENTPAAEEEIESSVQRYIVMPGQATSYKIGKKKILDLRELAQKELSFKFDIREFHDQVIKQGHIPLGLLETRIQKWIESKSR